MNYNTIILSGLPTSGKTTLAKRLSETYSWPIHTLGQLLRNKWESLYPTKKITFEKFWRNIDLQQLVNLNEEAKEIFSKGNLIGDSRYTHYCKDLPALLVFVTAAINIKAKRCLNSNKYEGESFEEIRKILLGREEDELRTGKKLYGENYDYRNPKNYHLVINTEMLSIGEEVRVILEIMPNQK